MKQNLVLLIFISFSCLHAQTWQWAKQSNIIVSAGLDVAQSVTTDPSGNVITSGAFGSQQISFGSYTLTNSFFTYMDVYLVKYSSTGSVIWAKSFGGTGHDNSKGLTTDASGNIYLSGSFSSPFIVFGTYTLSSTGIGNFYLVKIDPNGNVIWATSSNGSGATDGGVSVATDTEDNVFMLGTYSTSMVAVGSYTFINGGSNYNNFIVKYNSAGAIQWAKHLYGNGNDNARSIDCDASGNVIVTGNFSSYPFTVGTKTLAPFLWGADNYFIVKYDKNGNDLWAYSEGFNQHDEGAAVSIDPFDNIYVFGTFSSNTINFGAYTLTRSAPRDGFLLKYDPSGTVLWAKQLYGTYNTYAYSASAYSDGVFVSGAFDGTSIFSGTNTLNQPAGANDPMFIAKYDVNGTMVYSTALPTQWHAVNAITVNNSCDAYAVGAYTVNPLTIGSNSLTASGGDQNLFIAKLSFSCTAGIEEWGNSNDIGMVFPNPSDGNFAVKLPDVTESTLLEIYNSVDQKVFSQGIKNELTQIKALIEPGIYTVKIYSTTKLVSAHKIIVCN